MLMSSASRQTRRPFDLLSKGPLSGMSRRNAKAAWALAGLTDTPTDMLIDLLQSDEPIEPIVRAMMCDGLKADAPNPKIRLSFPEKLSIYRKGRKRRDRVRIGRAMASNIASACYVSRISVSANEAGMSAKLAERSVADFRKALKWLDGLSERIPIASDMSDDALLLAFAYAQTTKREPVTTMSSFSSPSNPNGST